MLHLHTSLGFKRIEESIWCKYCFNHI